MTRILNDAWDESIELRGPSLTSPVAEIVCPACHGVLVTIGAVLRCASCFRDFPIVLGIPDLRLWPDPYISPEEDRAKGIRLAQECAGFSFAQAANHYYAITEQVPPFQSQLFLAALGAAPQRADAQLDQWYSLSGSPTGRDTILEIGCGTGAFLSVAAARGIGATGVDVAFRWLVLARLRLAEAGLSARLICACAEALPFRDEVFDQVVADSTLENLRDQSMGLEESMRVLRKGGHIFVATPNRFSLGPDPHTGFWGGSFLPAALTAAIVSRRGGVPPVRRLFSENALKKLLEACGFRDVRIALPEIPAARRATASPFLQFAIAAYHTLTHSAAGRYVLRKIGPLLVAAGRKLPMPQADV